MRRLLFISFSVGLWLVAAVAQDATFTTSVEPPNPAAGEQFAVSFTSSGSDMPDTRSFKGPDLGRFVVMSGPNISQNMQFINGRMSASVTFTYYLYAREAGKYSIGSASVDVKGKTYKTEPVQIDIVAGKPRSPQREEQTSTAAEIGDNLFIRAIPSKQRVRQGEQLTVTYKLYTRVSMSDYSLSKVPTYEGFWAEDFEMSRNPEVTSEVHEGNQYRVVTLKRTALFATQSGSLKLAPLQVKCAVQVQSRRRSNDPFDIFNDPFFGRFQTVEQEVSSNALTITVDRLPAGAPETFSGAAGQYTLTASLDKPETRAGDPLTLKLTISGKGNVKLLVMPKPVFPADFEVYEPKISDEITREGGVIRGRKTAEYLIIPRNAGERSIDPVAFTYFDLERNSYATQRSQRFEITVTPGRELASGSAGYAAKEDVRLLGEDIRYLKLELGSIVRHDDMPFANLWFVLGMMLPPLVLVGAFVYRKRIESISGNVTYWRSQKAGKEATKRLKIARRVLSTGNNIEFHNEISRALLGYLQDKLSIPKASLSIESAVARLKDRGVESTHSEAIESCIQRAEYARFAPGGDTQEARQDLLDGAAKAINLVEEVLNKQ